MLTVSQQQQQLISDTKPGTHLFVSGRTDPDGTNYPTSCPLKPATCKIPIVQLRGAPKLQLGLHPVDCQLQAP
jgi:hypothetical protein